MYIIKVYISKDELINKYISKIYNGKVNDENWIGIIRRNGQGAYQIGVLKAIESFIPKKEIKYISASSIGVLNAYAYIIDKTSLAEKMWRELCSDNKKKFLNQIIKKGIIQENINKIYDEKTMINKIFYCSLINFEKRKIQYKKLNEIDNKLIPEYLKASVTMPFINKAYTIKGEAYYDGAIVDNVPIYPLINKDLDYIICVSFDEYNNVVENYEFDKKIIKIIFPSKSRIRESILFSKEEIERMIIEGYDKSCRVFQFVFANGFENCEKIYKNINTINNVKGQKGMRISGDVMMTSLNKIIQKIIDNN